MSSAMTKTKQQQNQKYQHWTDQQIRFGDCHYTLEEDGVAGNNNTNHDLTAAAAAADNNKNHEEEDDDEEEEEYLNGKTITIDPFRINENPHEAFTYEYIHPCFYEVRSCHADDSSTIQEETKTTEGQTIKNKMKNLKQFKKRRIQIHGYKYDSDEMWNSTGLTLWDASYHMCSYLIEHYYSLLHLPTFTKTTRRVTGCTTAATATTPTAASTTANKLTTTKSPSTTGTTKTFRVLELGCGLGLCGLLVHDLLSTRTTIKIDRTSDRPREPIRDSIGGQDPRQTSSEVEEDFCQEEQETNFSSSFHVYLTDGDIDTLDQLEQNIDLYNQANNKKRMTSSSSSSSKWIQGTTTTLSCHQLLWNRDKALQFLSSSSPSREHDFDNNEDVNNNNKDSDKTIDNEEELKFHLIFAADVIYATEVVQPLFETVKVSLKQRRHDSKQEKENDEEPFSLSKTTTQKLPPSQPPPLFLLIFCQRQVPVTIDYVLEVASNMGFQYNHYQEQQTQEENYAAQQQPQPLSFQGKANDTTSNVFVCQFWH